MSQAEKVWGCGVWDVLRYLLAHVQHERSFLMDERTRAVQTSYDRVAAPYAARFSYELAQKPLDRALLDYFAEQVRGRGPVVDVGCGPGQVAHYLHTRGVPVSGLDLSPEMVAHARRL